MKQSFLKHIDSPADLRKIKQEDLPLLAEEIRRLIIDVVANKQGHLGASLGVVELTIALHYVFNTPQDRLIWDVGHQAYGHKILTGRREAFNTNRQWGGISGFPKRSESIYDPFGTGHSSTSISAALGMALVSLLKDEKKTHIAVIGDASITSGMAFEGLNHAGFTKANLLIVLNDNSMGIDPSVGAFKQYLSRLKAGLSNRDIFFEALNIDYSGPVDGHDINALISELQDLKFASRPRLLHVITKKGKGLKRAEEEQVKYHAPERFDAITGEIKEAPNKFQSSKFQDVFGKTLVELADTNQRIIGITPAMPTGSSMKFMIDKYPDRAYDVGISEQHAVTLAAGMAAEGFIPFCNIYSTFLQRAYDQVIHDVALQSLPVVLCLDRAGLVGEDGATHHGLFDLSYLRTVPNMIVFSPRNEIELRNMMYTAQLGLDKPIAIRYPRGRGLIAHWKQPFKKLPIGEGEKIKEGTKLCVLTVGTIAQNVSHAIDLINDHDSISHYDMRFVKPLDEKLLDEAFQSHQTVVTAESGSVVGGFGSAVLAFSALRGYKNKIVTLGVPDQFIDHGKVEELEIFCGLDPVSLHKKIGLLLD